MPGDTVDINQTTQHGLAMQPDSSCLWLVAAAHQPPSRHVCVCSPRLCPIKDVLSALLKGGLTQSPLPRVRLFSPACPSLTLDQHLCLCCCSWCRSRCCGCRLSLQLFLAVLALWLHSRSVRVKCHTLPDGAKNKTGPPGWELALEEMTNHFRS